MNKLLSYLSFSRCTGTHLLQLQSSTSNQFRQLLLLQQLENRIRFALVGKFEDGRQGDCASNTSCSAPPRVGHLFVQAFSTVSRFCIVSRGEVSSPDVHVTEPCAGCSCSRETNFARPIGRWVYYDIARRQMSPMRHTCQCANCRECCFGVVHEQPVPCAVQGRARLLSMTSKAVF